MRVVRQEVRPRDLAVGEITQNLFNRALGRRPETATATSHHPDDIALAQLEAGLRRQDDLLIVAQHPESAATAGFAAGGAGGWKTVPVGIAEEFGSILQHLIFPARTKTAAMPAGATGVGQQLIALQHQERVIKLHRLD